MEKIKPLLTLLLQRAGLPASQLAEILSEKASEETIEAATALCEANLFNETAAVANIAVRDKVMAKTLGGVDAAILTHLSSEGIRRFIDDETFERIKQGKTSERVKAAIDALVNRYNEDFEQWRTKAAASEDVTKALKEKEAALKASLQKAQELEQAVSKAQEAAYEKIGQFQALQEASKLPYLFDGEVKSLIVKDVVSKAMGKYRFRAGEDGALQVLTLTGEPALDEKTQQPLQLENIFKPLAEPYLHKGGVDQKQRNNNQRSAEGAAADDKTRALLEAAQKFNV